MISSEHRQAASIKVNVLPEDRAKLCDIALDRGMSLSGLVREIIVHYLESNITNYTNVSKESK